MSAIIIIIEVIEQSTIDDALNVIQDDFYPFQSQLSLQAAVVVVGCGWCWFSWLNQRGLVGWLHQHG